MGQIRAQGLQQSADAQARAQAANGQIWGGAIAQLGQIPGEMAKYKLADTENQVRQQQLATQKRYAQGEQDANWIYQGLMKPGPDGTVNIDESTLPKLQAGMANAGVPLEVQDRTVNSLKSVMEANTSFRQSQIDHQVKIAKAVLAGVTPDHPLTPGSALATLKMAQTNGIANAHDVDQFMAAMNQGHDPADLFKAIIQYGQGPQKPITNTVEAGIAAGMTPQAVFDREKPPPTAPAPKVPDNAWQAAYTAIVKDPMHPTVDELTQVQAAAAKSTEPTQRSLTTKAVLLDGKPAEVVFDPASGNWKRGEEVIAPERIKPMPPASVQYPKPEAGQQPEIEIKPGTRMYRVAQDIAYGTLTMSDFNRIYGRAMGNAATKAAIYDTARQLNPDFKPSAFELGYKLAGNPAIRQRLVAIDSLGPVIDKIEGLAQQADLTNVPALNKMLSAGKFAVGDKTITNYRQLQTLLGDEVGNALGVGSGSDLKTKLGLDLVNPNLGPQQFIASMEQIRSVLGARKDTLLKQFGPYKDAVDGGAPAAPQNTPPPVNQKDPLGILGR